MAEYLVIRLGATATQPVSWIAVDDRGMRRGQVGSGSLADAAGHIGERPVIVLVPASDVPTFAVDVPARGARLLAALPFALEDRVADDVENLHFAAGKAGPGGSIHVSVVARQTLSAWLARLDEAGISASRIVPENHGLARTPNTLSLLVADEQIFFNDGGETTLAITGMRPAELIAATGLIGDDEADNPNNLLVYCDAAVNATYEKDWALLRHELASVDVNLLPDGILPRLAVTVASGEGINLLQGAYGPRTEMAAMVQPWKYAAMFLLALGVVGILGKGADYYRLSLENTALQQQFTSEYQRLRPGFDRDVADPIAAIDSLRRSIGGSSSANQVFLPSLLQLAEALQQNKEAVVEAVSYRAGVIDVRLNSPDIPTLTRIVEAVSASGRFRASLKSADNVGDRVNSRIEVRESGS